MQIESHVKEKWAESGRGSKTLTIIKRTTNVIIIIDTSHNKTRFELKVSRIRLGTPEEVKKAFVALKVP